MRESRKIWHIFYELWNPNYDLEFTKYWQALIIDWSSVCNNKSDFGLREILKKKKKIKRTNLLFYFQRCISFSSLKRIFILFIQFHIFLSAYLKNIFLITHSSFMSSILFFSHFQEFLVEFTQLFFCSLFFRKKFFHKL